MECPADWLLVVVVVVALGCLPMIFDYTDGAWSRRPKPDDHPSKKALKKRIQFIGVVILVLGASHALLSTLFC